ncbi:hypothetical protein [Streptomonospora sp. PA3]|uniref:hypothetical protein n=1 Tax=Streptomonospora sp. PA3 TaxID=2607326 RepID=UPI0016424194|nr:hypothetical protein [Streptomonospora sp. PA3]
MEFIGVPLVALIRSLGPPLVVLAVGAVLLVRRRPVRARLLWAALAVQVAAAALPYAWLLLQAATGIGGHRLVGPAMILVQPGVEALAWLCALAAVTAAAPRRGSPSVDGDAAEAGGPPAARRERTGGRRAGGRAEAVSGNGAYNRRGGSRRSGSGRP